MRNDEVQPAVLRMLVGGAVLGFARPRTWWCWALALAAWVPAEPLLDAAFALGARPEANLGGWLLPPIPAFLGAFLGRSMALGMLASPGTGPAPGDGGPTS